MSVWLVGTSFRDAERGDGEQLFGMRGEELGRRRGGTGEDEGGAPEVDAVLVHVADQAVGGERVAAIEVAEAKGSAWGFPSWRGWDGCNGVGACWR